MQYLWDILACLVPHDIARGDGMQAANSQEQKPE